MAEGSLKLRDRTVRGQSLASMKADSDALSPPKRRSQAERRATTRAKVVLAARTLLRAQGYTGATTLAIRDASGLSTGAIQGQFPTKAEIMEAVFEEILERRKANIEAAMQQGTARDITERLLDVYIEYCLTDDPIIITELLLAKRNDPDLSLFIDHLSNEFYSWNLEVSEAVYRAAGMSEARRRVMFDICSAFVRGASLESMLKLDKLDLKNMLVSWREMMLDWAFRNPAA